MPYINCRVTVVIDDMTSGQFTIGGHPITTEGVNDLLPAAPTTA
jgi:phenylpyruvate tautomerase PptA (4-oxalocrotonate tautomerase family)